MKVTLSNQNLSMAREARLVPAPLGEDGKSEALPSFFCWGKDCPVQIGYVIHGDGGSVGNIALPNFVWSKVEKLYLMPKKFGEELKKGARKGAEERGRQIAQIDQEYLHLLRTRGEKAANRFLNQKVKETPRTVCAYILADGQSAYARCPLCLKVNILCYAANGKAIDDTQREIQPNNGHLGLLTKPP